MHLGEARQFIYGNSGIFNAQTMSMKFTKRFTGATVAAVVETCASLSWHVVPLRIIHVAELAVAIVGSNSSPTFCPIPTNFLQVEEVGKRAPRKPRTNSEFSSISGSNDRKVGWKSLPGPPFPGREWPIHLRPSRRQDHLCHLSHPVWLAKCKPWKIA